MKPSRRLFLGLCAGSSLSGIDAALIETDGAGLALQPRLIAFAHKPLSQDLREVLRRIAGNESSTIRQVGMADRVLGESFLAAGRGLMEQLRIPWADLFAIGCLGFTTWHEPGARIPSTLSLGMVSVLAEKTGTTVVSDFRSRDVSLGGQGFPLTPVVDYLLLHRPGEDRVVMHLGGVATVVTLPGQPGLRSVSGFQAAPCNILLDGLMRRLTHGREPFDAGGKHAVQGRCIEELLEEWMRLPVLQRRPPKTVSAVDFGTDFLDRTLQQARERPWSLHDLLCTATHFAARATAEAVKRFVPIRPSRFLVSGGGVKNGLLWRLLEQYLPDAPLERLDDHGIPAEGRQSFAAAVLAALTIDGVPANLPAATGAEAARLLGQITPGQPANWSRCLQWMAHAAKPVRLAA